MSNILPYPTNINVACGAEAVFSLPFLPIDYCVWGEVLPILPVIIVCGVTVVLFREKNGRRNTVVDFVLGCCFWLFTENDEWIVYWIKCTWCLSPEKD